MLTMHYELYILNSKQMNRQRTPLPFTPSASQRTLAKVSSLDRINTQISTQQTARQLTNRHTNNNIPQFPMAKNHITFLESVDQQPEGMRGSDVRNSRGLINKVQRQFGYYGKAQREGESKSPRRRKIFDQEYANKNRSSARSSNNFNASSQSLTNHVQQPKLKFIDTIPLVQRRIVKVSSLNQLHRFPTIAKSPNKITFTYTKSHFFTQPQFLGEQKSAPALLPLVKPVFNIRPQQSNHKNPMGLKIKKPKPTNSKQQSKHKGNTFASKVSLGNCSGLIRGYSLLNQKDQHNQSLSNIENRSCNRYYDQDDQEDKLLAYKISYKNIEIDNHSENKGENYSEIHAQNIFEDFEHKRMECEHSLRHQGSTRQLESNNKGKQGQRKDANMLQVPREQAYGSNGNILQRQVFAIETVCLKQSKVLFPMLLVGVAFLLLLIQILS